MHESQLAMRSELRSRGLDAHKEQVASSCAREVKDRSVVVLGGEFRLDERSVVPKLEAFALVLGATARTHVRITHGPLQPWLRLVTKASTSSPSLSSTTAVLI